MNDLPLLISAFGLEAELVPYHSKPPGSITARVQSDQADSVVPEGSALGVECGPQTGLLVLVFGSEEAGKRFLSTNPDLSQALVIRIQERLAIWLKPENRLPPHSLQIEDTFVITESVFPVFTTPQAPFQCLVYQSGRPIRVDLGRLTFEGRLREMICGWLIQQRHGVPITTDKRNRRRVNVAYWAAFIKEVLDIRFHLTRGVFLGPVPGRQERIVLEREKVFELISSALEQAHRTFGELPAGELAVCRIQQIVRRMQVIGAITDPSAEEIASQFVRTKLRPTPGTTMSANEAAVELHEFLASRGLPPWSKRIAHRELKRAIGQLLGVRQSGDVKRAGKAKRGYRGLSLSE